MKDTSDHQELARLRAFAAEARERLGHLPQLANPAAQAESEQAMKLADELYERTAEPISIGLVGEYSVGKSRLLNALVDLPGLLPVSSAPTTGNITALRIRAVRPGEQPGPLTAAVSYMSRPELSSVARFMLGELRSVVNHDRLQYDVTSLQRYDPVTDGWQQFEELARSWWQRDQVTNLELRLYAWELLRLRNALLVGAELIPQRGQGRPIPIETELVQEAVEIGDSRDLPDRFPERPGRRPIPADARLTAAELHATFPLIRRLTYEVAIDPELWRLGGLRDSNGLELLDFAGLHTAGAARDEFLCGRELERITGYVEVVAAAHPETRTATRFPSMLEGRRRSKAYLSDSVLLVANKFDEVPPVEPAATLDDLGTASRELRSLLRTARGLSPQLHRVALTSAVVAHGDPRWAAVANTLPAQDPDSAEAQIAVALRAYVADGGITRLRELLDWHISTEALPIMVSELTALRTELSASLSRLRVLLEPGPVREQEDADRRLLGDLVVGLHSMITELKTAATYFRDPQGIEVAAADGTLDARLLERIRQEAVLAVYAWPEWRALLSGFRKGEILRPADATAELARTSAVGYGRFAEDEDEDDEFGQLMAVVNRVDYDDRTVDSTVTFPVSTKDLEGAFAEALSDLRVSAASLALDVVREWVNVRYQRHALVRSQMADSRTRHLLAGRLAALHPDGGVAVLGLLDMIVDISWVPDQFDRALRKIEQRTAEAGANAYPLAPEHALPWHPAYESSAEEKSLSLRRHHSRAHRLRHDLAEGLAFPVQTAVAVAFGSLSGVLEARLDMLQAQVPNQSALLVAPAPDAAGETGQRPEPGLFDGLLDDPGTDAGDDPQDRNDDPGY